MVAHNEIVIPVSVRALKGPPTSHSHFGKSHDSLLSKQMWYFGYWTKIKKKVILPMSTPPAVVLILSQEISGAESKHPAELV